MADSTYIIQHGDTLSAIAKRNGTTVGELAHLNGIRDPNQISIGQTLQLHAPASPAPAVHSVQALFLDLLRHPIEGLHYRMRGGGEAIAGTSLTNGLSQALNLRKTATITIAVQVAWLDNRWFDVATIQAVPGHKVVTLISPMLRIKAPLAPHPKGPFGQPKQEEPSHKSSTLHPRGTPATGKGKPQSEVAKGSGKGLHSREEKDPNGITRVVLSQDLPDLKDCFAAYTGEQITEDDWEEAALRLKCDAAVLKAIPVVETSGIGGFFPDSGTPPIPTILYERTWFHRKTGGQYDATNADLSMPPPKVLRALKASKNQDDQEEYARLQAVRMYPRGDHNGTANYRRFVNACLLNENAAIESCSWGKFQIMGFNYKNCGFNDHRSFLKSAFTSEKAQFQMYTGFIQHNQGGALHEAVTAKNWVRIAEIYNGAAEAKTPAWWKKQHPTKPWVPYHVKLKEAYDHIKATA